MEMEVRSNRTLIGRLTSHVEGKLSLLSNNLHIVKHLITNNAIWRCLTWATCYQLV